jgi:hypothetical protein
MQITGSLINHQFKERIELRHGILPMEYSPLRGRHGGHALAFAAHPATNSRAYTIL